MTFTVRTLADLSLGVVLALCALSGCKPTTTLAQPTRDGGLQLVGHRTDVEPLVTPARIDAWLEWQTRIRRELGPLSRDGGAGLRVRALAEARLMRDVKLDEAQVDAIEAVVSAVLAERDVARLSGAAALGEFTAGLSQLTEAQRTSVEAALKEASARAAGDGGLGALRVQFGDDAVQAVLEREAALRAVNDFPQP